MVGSRPGFGAELTCPDPHCSVQGVGASLVCGFSRALCECPQKKVKWTEAPQSQDASLPAPEPPFCHLGHSSESMRGGGYEVYPSPLPPPTTPQLTPPPLCGRAVARATAPPLPAPPHATAPVSAWRRVQLQSARAAATAGSGPRFAAPGALAGNNRTLPRPCFRPRRPVPRRWPDLADQLALRLDLRLPSRRGDPPTRPCPGPLCLVGTPHLMTPGGGLRWRGMPQTLRCAVAPLTLRCLSGPVQPSRVFFCPWEGRAWGPTSGRGARCTWPLCALPTAVLPWGSVCRSVGVSCALETRARVPSVPPFVWIPEGRSSPSWAPAVPVAGWEQSLRLAGRGRGPCGCAVQAFSLQRSGRQVS